ncbi:MAG: guanylate kinase [Oscillospiraceae bacterium]|nr:guanylate kinase [Oscillospiraceae bacterium]MBQ3501338.1 guanylate kinase [Oscillospiraceae bacterium]
MNKRGVLTVISGPSGVGKGTIINRLFEIEENLYFSVSATTRNPRPGEIDGVHYSFKSREEFEHDIETGEMLEHAVFNGNYYGTPKSAVEEKLSAGKDVVLDIEIQGARNVKRLMPEAVLVYILPPSIDELKKRLVGRNTEDAETIKGRLSTAYRELHEAPELYDYFIVNDMVENAAIKIKDIIEGERCSGNAMQEVLKQILEEAENLA